VAHLTVFITPLMLFHMWSLFPLSLVSPGNMRANRATHFSVAASAASLPHGHQAHHRGESRWIRRSNLYSCRLGVVFVARLWPAFALSPMTRSVASNKDAPDLVPKQRPPLHLATDMRARVLGGVGAATTTPLWLLSPSSTVVAACAPTLLWSIRGDVHERGRRAIASMVMMSAHYRS
jgi:hypothetical protein